MSCIVQTVLLRALLGMKYLPGQSGKPTGRNQATRRQRCARHTCWTHGFRLIRSLLMRSTGLKPCSHTTKDMVPAFRHSLLVVIRNNPEGLWLKLDKGAAVFLVKRVFT